jgi:hypothetical protein
VSGKDGVVEGDGGAAVAVRPEAIPASVVSTPRRNLLTVDVIGLVSHR